MSTAHRGQGDAVFMFCWTDWRIIVQRKRVNKFNVAKGANSSKLCCNEGRIVGKFHLAGWAHPASILCVNFHNSIAFFTFRERKPLLHWSRPNPYYCILFTRLFSFPMFMFISFARSGQEWSCLVGSIRTLLFFTGNCHELTDQKMRAQVVPEISSE
jgi:hypothetical protein